MDVVAVDEIPTPASCEVGEIGGTWLQRQVVKFVAVAEHRYAMTSEGLIPLGLEARLALDGDRDDPALALKYCFIRGVEGRDGKYDAEDSGVFVPRNEGPARDRALLKRSGIFMNYSADKVDGRSFIVSCGFTSVGAPELVARFVKGGAEETFAAAMNFLFRERLEGMVFKKGETVESNDVIYKLVEPKNVDDLKSNFFTMTTRVVGPDYDVLELVQLADARQWASGCDARQWMRDRGIVIKPLSTAKLRVCANCGLDARSGKLRACGACKMVMYCSDSCQRIHWSKGGHKVQCKIMTQEQSSDKKLPFDYRKLTKQIMLKWQHSNFCVRHIDGQCGNNHATNLMGVRISDALRHHPEWTTDWHCDLDPIEIDDVLAHTVDFADLLDRSSKD